MFSILKKIFSGISGKGKAEKQPFQKKEFHTPDTHLKRHSKAKPEKKDIPEQEKGHKGIHQPSAAQKTAAQVQQVQGKKTSHPGYSGKKNRKPAAKTVNRLGIPVYEKHTDFSKYFAEETEERETSLPAGKAKTRPQKTEIPAKSTIRQSRPVQERNKNGIPIFRSEEDISRYFREEQAPGMDGNLSERSGPSRAGSRHSAGKDFHDLLEKSLAQSGMEEMLKRKFAGLPSAPPIPLRKKLAAYPPPQEVMDLHGCTADQAEEKTGAFIRRARHKGMRTLLIIVGKGLHSEGEAVLPDVVENRLLLLKQQNWVLAYEWEKKIRRRSGALIVYLNDLG